MREIPICLCLFEDDNNGVCNFLISEFPQKSDADLRAIIRQFPNPQHLAHQEAARILDERRDRLEEARHKALTDRLDELAKPSKIDRKTYRLVQLSIAVAIVAAIITWLAWKHPVALPASPLQTPQPKPAGTK